MVKIKRKSFDILQPKPLLLILALVVVGNVYLFLPLVQNSQVYKSAESFYRENVWVTYTSRRASFSFQHPLSWPVAVATDQDLEESNIFDKEGYGEIEAIDFNEEWYRNAGGPRFGFINVSKLENINTLEELVKETDKETSVSSPSIGTVIIPRPKIDYSVVGGEKAITVKSRSTLASFSRTVANYTVVRNGLIYTFAAIDSERFLSHEKENIQIFNKIISSIKFTR